MEVQGILRAYTCVALFHLGFAFRMMLQALDAIVFIQSLTAVYSI